MKNIKDKNMKKLFSGMGKKKKDEPDDRGPSLFLYFILHIFHTSYISYSYISYIVFSYISIGPTSLFLFTPTSPVRKLMTWLVSKKNEKKREKEI